MTTGAILTLLVWARQWPALAPGALWPGQDTGCQYHSCAGTAGLEKIRVGCINHLKFFFFRIMSNASVSIDDARQTKRQKLRDERKRILKICINKLQRIQDPESVLCRSVLINNTLRSIQEEHKQSQRRVKLKRQKESYCDDLETKRMRLGELDRGVDCDADDEEGDIKTDDISGDVTRPLCTFDEVILCDNTEMSNDIHVWCEEELGQVESEEIEDNDDISNSSFDFSISALSYKQSSDKYSHTLENNNAITSTQISETEDYSGTPTQYVDSFSNSLLHSSSISLKS